MRSLKHMVLSKGSKMNRNILLYQAISSSRLSFRPKNGEITCQRLIGGFAAKVLPKYDPEKRVKRNSDGVPIETPSSHNKWMRVRYRNEDPIEKSIYRHARDDTTRSDPEEARQISDEKMARLKKSLEAKGFAREITPYDPPKNAEQLVLNAFEESSGQKKAEDLMSMALSDHLFKFKFLGLCASKFNHEVPNSDLHRVKTVGDVVQFYCQPVRGINSYDKLVRDQDELPANLFVLPEAQRFDPNDTSAFHKGIDAFPGMRDRMNGLRAQKKYPSLKKQINWPDI